jgi:hypothetical protein
MADASKPEMTNQQQPTTGISSKMNEHNHNYHNCHNGITISRQQARSSIYPAWPQQGNNLGWHSFFQHNGHGYGNTHHLEPEDRCPGWTTGGRTGGEMSWSNPTRPEEETTKHQNKLISHGHNYFRQPGREAMEPNPTQNESLLTQEPLSGGDDTKQKTVIELTLTKDRINTKQRINQRQPLTKSGS